MGKKCLVTGCGRRPLDETERRTYHMLPMDDTRSHWIEFVTKANCDGADPVGKKIYAYVCSRHFNQCCFEEKKSRRIKNGHIPFLALSNGKLEPVSVSLCPTLAVPLEITVPVENRDETAEDRNEQVFANEILIPPGQGCEPGTQILQRRVEKRDNEEEIHELRKKLKLSEEKTQVREKQLESLKSNLKKVQSSLHSTEFKLQRRDEKIKKLKTYLGEEEQHKRLLINLLDEVKERNHELSHITNPILKEINDRGPHGQKKSRVQYSKLLQQFAMKVYYYSPKAYDVLRDELDDALPHVRTLRNWLSTINAKPGFLEASIEYIKNKCKGEKKIQCGILLDEVHIRKQTLVHGDKMVGYVDYGGICTDKKEGVEKAGAALFVMAVGLNSTWKVPLAYVLTNGSSENLLKEIIQKSAELLHSCGAQMRTVTFDGLSSNLSAVKKLGANLDVTSKDFRPFFPHPSTNHPVYVFLDPPHMLKLVRNALEFIKAFRNKDKQPIEWKYFVQLNKLQEEMGLVLGNKLNSRNVNFKQQKMKVRLCVQLLSNSVATSLKFLKKVGEKGFQDAEPTLNFVQSLDRLFDLLNAHALGKGTKSPLRDWNKNAWNQTLDTAEELLRNLETIRGESMLKHDRCTGFQGLLICIKSTRMFMAEILTGKIPNMTYFTPYRICQDHLELFFGILRARFGNNNNPNCVQLEAAIKRILAVSLKPNLGGNCVPLEDREFHQICPLSLVKATATPCGRHVPVQVEEDFDPSSLPSLDKLEHSLIIRNIVVYISGFVGKKIVQKWKCASCCASLLSADDDTTVNLPEMLLINEKNNGGLFIPSNDLVKVCEIAETVIRVSQAGGIPSLCVSQITNKVVIAVSSLNIFNDMECDDFEPGDDYRDHVLKFQKLIIALYVKIRVHHIARQDHLVTNPESIRNRNVKLILFRGH